MQQSGSQSDCMMNLELTSAVSSRRLLWLLVDLQMIRQLTAHDSPQAAVESSKNPRKERLAEAASHSLADARHGMLGRWAASSGRQS
jgi:hypothetical protein